MSEAVLLREILSQLADLSERVTRLENETTPVAAAPPALPVAANDGISEEELLVISAAVAAWLGVRAHIRQVRLIRTGVWAQEGRVTIQASHWLHH